PAETKDYDRILCNYKPVVLGYIGISDHTVDFSLWRKHRPPIIEWHYGLPDSTGLDAGPFMRTPEMLREVL
ncbi:MAG: hypothetical protein WC369_08590, partial [Dehalococcoidales bacterium]